MISRAIRRARKSGDTEELRRIYGQHDQRDRVRRKAVMALHFNFSPDSTDLLRDICQRESNEGIRALAASMLVDPRRDVPRTIVESFEFESSPKVLKMVAHRLSQDNSSESIAFLQSLLKNPDWHVRLESLRSLEIIGGPDVLDAAVSGLEDPKATLRLWAVQVIAKTGAADTSEIIEAQISKEDGLGAAQMRDALESACDAAS